MATIFTESFETDGNGSRYTTSIPEFSDGSADFFTRTDGTNITSDYEVTGQDGSFYFAGMDLDDGGFNDSSQTLTLTNIDISGFENLSLSLLVAEDDAGDSNEDWDDDTQLLIEVSIDGGAFESLLDFQASSTGFNSEPALDTTGDGLGDGTALTPTFANFSSAIAGTGASMDVRISFNVLDAGDEDAAIDNIVIEGDAVPTTPDFNLQITEIWPGNDQNPDLTEDWFEVTNTGTEAWVAATEGDLYFDDVSASTADADLLSGISQIDPGETVIFIDDTNTVTFESVWAPVIDLTNVQIGTYSGAGLGGGGDAVNLFLDPNSDGDLSDVVTLDSEAYPDTASNPGASFDVPNAAFSVDGVNGAVATAPNSAGESAIGSPGNGAAIVPQVADFTLELLHFADQEANAATIDNIDNLSGVLNALRNEDLGGDGVADNTLTLSSGDAIIPGLFFDASEAVFGSAGIADIQIQNELGVEAIALGNHEFDLGTALLAGLIDGSASGDFSALTSGTAIDGQDFTGADFAYLSTNLDFSTDPNLEPLEVAGGGAPQANTVTSSVVIDVNGEDIGVVGATVPTIRSISSPGEDLGISPAWASGTPTDAELDALAAIIQAEVDALLIADPSLNKIILASHMQQISIELALAERLTDVDIIIAGGSNTRLFDDNDRIRDGDSDQGQYPQFVTNAGGTSTAVVNTDGTYKYVGRLVIDFDEDGNLIEGSYDETVSGAYATDDQGVADLNAESLIDPEIDAITDAIQAQIVATESNVFGVSDVFLNGNRSGAGTADDPDGVRTQETNLGNLTADANLDYANQIVSDQLVLGNDLGGDVLISIKNGGGIRANIGEIVVPPGGDEAVRLPNSAVLDETGTVVKPEGGISQNDIATTLAFNNGLVLVDMTKTELKDFLEGSVAAIENVSGGFPQISGLKFSFDQTQTAQTYNTDGSIAVAGERIINAAIFDENDILIAEIVRDGEIVGDSTESFRVVTLDFLANAGDEILSTLSNPNRVDLQDLDGDGADDGVVTGAATFADDGSEQDALAEYLNDNFNPDNGGVTFSEVDTGPALDERIQNVAFRADTVLPEALDLSLVISEIMYNPDSAEDDWEWIEITNTGTEVVDLSGFVLDDANASFHTEATIASGSIAAGESAVLYNADDLTAEQFSAAWGEGLNLVAVTDWAANGFNNGGDTVALWSSFADYSTDISTGSIVFDNTVDLVIYDDAAPFPVDDNDASIYLTDLTADNNDGANWALSEVGVATPTGTGRDSVPDAASGNDGDVGSPGGDPEIVIPPFEIPDPILVETVAGTISLAGAEIVDWDAATQRAFVTSGDGLQVVDASDLSNLSVIATLSAEDLGFDSSDITSVSVRNGIIAVARPDPTGFIDDPLGTPGTEGDEFTGAGQVLFYDAASLGFLGVVQVGALPDMVTWNETGTHVLVANEGQASGDENQPDASQNPNGSVSVIAFNATNPTASTVTTLDFTDSSITFEALDAKGVRVASPDNVPDGSTNFAPSAAADLEPEYITIEGNTAYIGLQENNAVAVITDITAPTAFTIDDILVLGTKDHSLADNALDPSNQDSGINIATYPVQGLFQPDGMASYTVDGQQYFFTANEGDGRDVDESRGADLVDGDLTNGEVDTTAFDAQTLADLADNAVLGRLKFSNIDGDTDGDGLIEELTSFGARSFSIFDAAGNLVFDSGSDFERITEILTPEEFNGNGLASSFDSRSDDKGPEPESVVLGEIDGSIYAFVGLERVGGIVVYDVTDPANSSFVQYIRNEDSNGDLIDIAPEGLRFIPSVESPTGNALLAVTSEESNTLTFHELTGLEPDITMIHDIQGITDVDASGTFQVGVDDVSALEGQEVTIEAVVTADFQDTLSGFFVQEEDADADALATTSEGIFIFDGSLSPELDVSVGDLVQVTGTVAEFFGETQISATEIEIVSSGNTLPTATVVEFPTFGLMLDDDGGLVAGLEQYEGMLITIPIEVEHLGDAHLVRDG
ncbi:MAG: choice-of-anchor I family protein, partial [Pseudomonadota bacterium]